MPLASALPPALRASPTARIAGTVLFNLLCYLCIGLPLAVIPGFVHATLGFDPVQAGLAVSIQYLATFLSRPAAGRIADTVGPKRAVLLGLGGCAGSGLMLLGAGLTSFYPAGSLFLLLCSRCLLGYAESCVATGSITWAIAIVGPERTAQVISMNGVTSYGGIALGA
ncbi:MAG: MFS transporter, partial [Gluconacetobacter diazotrophicus]|nr:MFS transporter [Gluconacetobacter diazotrophicus]